MLQTVFPPSFSYKKLYHGVRLVVRIPETEGKIITVIELTYTTTTTPINSRGNLHMHSISRGFSRGLSSNIQVSSETISYSHSILEM